MALVYRTQQLTEVYAKSGHWADIQDAVDQAAAAGGGIVYIPEGTWNFVNVGESWTGARVIVPPGVSIFGAPTERTSGLPYDGIGMNPNDQVVEWRTVLVMPWDVPGTWGSIPVWFKLGDGSQNPNKPIRFSDIKLVGYRSFNSSSVTLHRGIAIYGVINFRIDHCYFEHICGGAINIPNYYYQNFYCSGVIDHCYFVNIYGYDVLSDYTAGNIGYGVSIGRSYYAPGEQPMPYEPKENMLGKYTNHTVFIEDCYFSKWRHCVSSGHGGYYVFRHNTIENDFGHFSLDVHGLRDSEPGRAGGQGAEIYHNKFLNCSDQNSVRGVFQCGGGYGVWFNNYIDTSYSSSGIVLYPEDYVPSETWHVKDFYLWSSLGPWRSSWSGIPSGFDATRNVYADWTRPAYNSSDPRYPNTDQSWSIAGYTPYPYPHPLTLEGAPPSLVTPWTGTLEEGTYKITMPQQVQVGSDIYNFKQWEDGSINPVRTINLTSDMTITATYELAPLLTATIRGVVRDAETKKPIIGALVTCNGYSDVTEADGSYEFVDIPAKSYTLTVKKENYATATASVDASAGGTFILDFELTPMPKAPIFKIPITPLPLIIGAIITYLSQKKGWVKWVK